MQFIYFHSLKKKKLCLKNWEVCFKRYIGVDGSHRVGGMSQVGQQNGVSAFLAKVSGILDIVVNQENRLLQGGDGATSVWKAATWSRKSSQPWDLQCIAPTSLLNKTMRFLSTASATPCWDFCSFRPTCSKQLTMRYNSSRRFPELLHTCIICWKHTGSPAQCFWCHLMSTFLMATTNPSAIQQTPVPPLCLTPLGIGNTRRMKHRLSFKVTPTYG